MNSSSSSSSSSAPTQGRHLRDGVRIITITGVALFVAAMCYYATDTGIDVNVARPHARTNAKVQRIGHNSRSLAVFDIIAPGKPTIESTDPRQGDDSSLDDGMPMDAPNEDSEDDSSVPPSSRPSMSTTSPLTATPVATPPPPPPPPPPPATEDDRAALIKAYIMEHSISSEIDLSMEGSPQQKALEFMAVSDGFVMEIPTSDTSTPEGYAFMTRYVMAVLYHATGGDGWTYDLNFLKPISVCAWYSVLQYVDLSIENRGVACNEEMDEIRSIFMNKNNMVGNLPAELGLLTTLVNLDFDKNSISGSIPVSFQRLASLENFFVPGNQLVGALPPWIGTLTLLRNINFSFNLMTGLLPPSLGNLPNLEGLALDNNLFTGRVGDAFDSSIITGFRKLEKVYLEKNQFTGSLSDGFLNEMNAVIHLDISDNQLSGSIPPHLFELPELLVLDLHDNDFEALPEVFPQNSNLRMLALQKCRFADQTIPTSISNLEGLEHLDVSQNLFTGTIPTNIGSLRNLTYLFLADNDFVPGPIPPWIQGLTYLKELGMKSTERTGTIPLYIGTDLSDLILLDLDNNQLEGEIPTSLGDLENLIVLLLNRNNLTSVVPVELGFLQNLKLVFLEANNAITGSLDIFCNNINSPTVVAGCDLCDQVGDCCFLCCEEEVECNDGVFVPDLDPIWQFEYARKFFTFRTDDYFP